MQINKVKRRNKILHQPFSVCLVKYIQTPVLFSVIQVQFIAVPRYIFLYPRDSMLRQRLSVITALYHYIVLKLFQISAKSRLISLSASKCHQSVELYIPARILNKQHKRFFRNSRPNTLISALFCYRVSSHNLFPQIRKSISTTHLMRLHTTCKI